MRHILRFMPMVALLAASCMPPPAPPLEIPSNIMVDRPPSEVRADVDAALRELGLELEEDGPVIEARGEGWPMATLTACPRATISDPHSEDRGGRFRFVEAHDFSLRASIRIAANAAGGTDLSITTTHHGLYRNSYTARDERRRCRTSGVLERRVEEAARGPTT